MLCEYCAENEGTHTREGYDVAPTDRGEERRWMSEWVCDECDPSWRSSAALACFQLAQQCGHDGAKCKHYIAGYKRFAARSVTYNEMFWLVPRDGYDA